MNVEVGIYKITNLINGKIYIGQSRNIKKRWQNHKCAAHNPNNKAYNYPLYRAMRKYGIENFDFSILENCQINQLNEREKYWITYYSSDNGNYGYNNDSGGTSCPHPVKLTEEMVEEIIFMLKESTLSQSEIAENFKIDQSLISNINTGKNWVKEGINYPIRKGCYSSQQEQNKNYCISCGCEISKKATRCIKCYSFTQQKISRPEREEFKKLIRNSSFTSIGKMFGVTDNAIRKWCDSYNLPRRRSDIDKISDEEWLEI